MIERCKDTTTVASGLSTPCVLLVGQRDRVAFQSQPDHRPGHRLPHKQVGRPASLFPCLDGTGGEGQAILATPVRGEDMARFSQYLTPEKPYPTRGPCVLFEPAELFTHTTSVSCSADSQFSECVKG